MVTNKTCISITTSLFIFCSCNAFADGLTEFKNALATLNGNSPISATVESSFTETRGKRKKQKTKTGLIQVALNNTHHGLQLTFSDEILEKLENESDQKERDDEAKTPTLNAVDGVGVTEMKQMLSAAPSLLRFINKAEFINEENVEHNNQIVRQLNFKLPLESIIDNKDIHEYVDDFNGNYHVKIDENGIPIESNITFNGSGSAYIFFSMEISQSSTTSYQLIEDRLVKTKRVFQRDQSSTWGKTTANGYKILVVNPSEVSLAATQ